MPKIEKMYTLEVGVEQFLNACSPLELKEIEMLIFSPRFQNKMNGHQEPRPIRPEFPEDRVEVNVHLMRNPPPPPEKGWIKTKFPVPKFLGKDDPEDTMS